MCLNRLPKLKKCLFCISLRDGVFMISKGGLVSILHVLLFIENAFKSTFIITEHRKTSFPCSVLIIIVSLLIHSLIIAGIQTFQNSQYMHYYFIEYDFAFLVPYPKGKIRTLILRPIFTKLRSRPNLSPKYLGIKMHFTVDLEPLNEIK
ncbi:unnamed protein product [Diatraea saccharalis]|uniref:Uncharacterized protein n=1 Tax=Diatraea saccharalis TaxID=40085 RepID=A0A9N9WK51_9NEOP|nr:unnamed protein product [Diatraea saccharalis]